MTSPPAIVVFPVSAAAAPVESLPVYNHAKHVQLGQYWGVNRSQGRTGVSRLFTGIPPSLLGRER